MIPTVSIIVPCYNEQATIRPLLDSILAQTYPRERLEVVISDGLSVDGTRNLIASYQSEHPELRVQMVDNWSRTIPSGLNRAIEAACGEILIRLDAHSVPYPEYVERCVQALEEGHGTNVGGVWEVQAGATTWIGNAIAAAAAHPLGVGDAMYRLSPEAGAVDTVPFGSFRRSLIDTIGKFDETLLSNEDYEFNARVRQAGGMVWLDPAIRSVYIARATLGALGSQYWRYGFWKFRMLQRYPATLRWRQALPPLFVASLIGLGILSIWFGLARFVLAAELAVYFVALLLGSLRTAIKQRSISLAFGLPLAISSMHLAWGGGFLWSILSSPAQKIMTESRAPFRLRPSEQRSILLIGDLLASVGAMFSAVYIWYQYRLYQLIQDGMPEQRAIRLIEIVVPIWFYLLPLAWILLMVELYDPHASANWRRTVRGIVAAAFVGLLAYSVLFTIRQDPNSLPRIGVGAFLLLASLLTLLWRAVYIRLYTSTGLQRRVLIVGAGKAGQTLAEVYRTLTPPPFRLVGFIDDDPKKVGRYEMSFPIIAPSDQQLKVIEDSKTTDVVVAITGIMRGATFQIILDAQERGIEVTRMPTLYEEIAGRVPIHHLESDWMLRSFIDQARSSGFYELTKRLLDILGGLAGLLLMVITFPMTALAIVLDSGFPIFYSQPRLGRSGRPYVVYKYRSMINEAEADGSVKPAAENDPRITRVGKVLRRTRLDELPQFWNVLRGEMSLVGPRAERYELVNAYQKQIPFYRARLLVKPGLTGWAQINYGYAATVYDTVIKLEYDLYYIKHRTLAMDINIILRTIGTVIRRTGR
jgi:exopolysaccharide biosynthesis polyprenyl glycosylphosphotransferase